MEKVNLVLGLANVSCAIIGAALSIPLIRGKVKMNAIYGIRFPKALESDENWYAINATGGRILLGWSIGLLMVGVSCFFLHLPKGPVRILAGLAAAIVYLIATLHVYLYSRKL